MSLRIFCRAVNTAAGANVLNAPAEISHYVFVIEAPELEAWLSETERIHYEHREVLGAQVIPDGEGREA